MATQVGSPERHKLVQCPPLVAEMVKKQEKSEEKTQPWPMGAKHLKLRVGYFDYDAKKESQNSLNNIIGVEFLAEFGATTMINEDTGKTFYYYRVQELQTLIVKKIKGEKLLFNHLEEN